MQENPIRLDSSDEEGTPSPRRAPPTQAVDLSSNPEAGVVCETSGIARKLAVRWCLVVGAWGVANQPRVTGMARRGTQGMYPECLFPSDYARLPL